METRFTVRKEADKQKQTIVNAFESMKKKGKIDNSSLQKLGLDIEIKEEVQEENLAGGQDLELVKERQSREMRALLEQESNKERQRNEQMNNAQDDEEKAQLKREAEKAKAISSDKIAHLK